jgi:hypothetical protein
MCDQWSPTHAADIDWRIGAWVKTENVNTSPANDDARWYLKWEFYNQAGTFIGRRCCGRSSVAHSGGWIADTNTVETILRRILAWQSSMLSRGKDATGTIWWSFIMESRGAWAGNMQNETLICPAGWYYSCR